MIAIKHRFTGATICEFDVKTIKEASELSKANLSGADLSGADLYGAKIDGEKITKNPLSITGLYYSCLITDGYMRLGCKRYTHAEWSEFNDSEIAAMDSRATDFWNKWKLPLLAMCKQHAEEA